MRLMKNYFTSYTHVIVAERKKICKKIKTRTMIKLDFRTEMELKKVIEKCLVNDLLH